VDSKPLKEQWSIALRKRVGILKMGGFLHSGFQSVSLTMPSTGHNYTIARLPRNSSKCRPSAPLPPAHSRVKLQLVFEEVGSDFINASYLGRPSFPREFVITQLPLRETVSDFWRMLWEQRVSVVLVIGDVSEDVRVWPGNGEEDRHPLVVNSNWENGALTVAGIKMYQGTIPTLTVHQFSLSSAVDAETDYVTLYHFTGWPQGGVAQAPRDVANLVHLLLATRQQQTVAAVSHKPAYQCV
jgi:protein tyrosine phosphatase